MPITVVNFLWGDWPGQNKLGRDLAPLYVKCFRKAMKRYYDREFRHVIFTDRLDFLPKFYTDHEDNLHLKKLGPCAKWGGCLPKFRALAKDPDLIGQILVMDLDNVFRGNLSPLFDYRGDFAICSDVDPKRPNSRVGGNIASFPAGRWHGLWTKIKDNTDYYRELSNGSERFLFEHFLDTRELSTCDYWNELSPGLIRSFKRNTEEDLMRSSVIWTHGQPRPHKLWRKKGWRHYCEWRGW